ncbi:MAG: J domain-containing protein, partial [Actinomycetota bacterium]
MTDHYAVLGVARNATTDDIRRAYRNRMRTAHPDSRG